MTDQADSPLRQQIAEAIHHNRFPFDSWDRQPAGIQADYLDCADAVLAVILPGARITATLAHMSEADVQRVITLYERWVKAGPPPLGTSMSRWWDARLVELHDAILPPEQQTQAGPTVAEAAANDRRWWNGEKAGEQ